MPTTARKIWLRDNGHSLLRISFSVRHCDYEKHVLEFIAKLLMEFVGSEYATQTSKFD